MKGTTRRKTMTLETKAMPQAQDEVLTCEACKTPEGKPREFLGKAALGAHMFYKHDIRMTGRAGFQSMKDRMLAELRLRKSKITEELMEYDRIEKALTGEGDGK